MNEYDMDEYDINDHEKLKFICDTIKYNVWELDSDFDNHFIAFVCSEYRIINVREVIFTTDFMNKLVSYTWNKNRDNDSLRVYYDLMIHLDDPVEYLYTLVKE